MQTFATAWLVASQSRSPATAALAQTVTQAPIFLFALFGGVLADRMDRARYLLCVNIQMALAALCLALLALSAAPSVMAIFALTFVIGAGAAFKVSAWQASMSALVAPEEIEAAATLNGLSYNLASIIGPILGAGLFARSGAWVLFLANALSFLGLIVLYLEREKEHTIKPAVSPACESYMHSLQAGLESCFGNRAFRGILGLTLLLFFAVSAFHALLPVFVKTVLAAQGAMLGWLMSAFGGGAVTAAFALPGLRFLLPRAYLLAAAAGMFGVMLCYFGIAPAAYGLIAATALAGFSWAVLVSTMNSAAQSAFSSTMRARALAIYSMVFAGALMFGSFIWGHLAARLGIALALRSAGIFILAVAAVLFFRTLKTAGTPYKKLFSES